MEDEDQEEKEDEKEEEEKENEDQDEPEVRGGAAACGRRRGAGRRQCGRAWPATEGLAINTASARYSYKSAIVQC